MRNRLAFAALFVLFAAPVLAATISKPPDVGPYWQTLGPSNSRVYADSFVAPSNELRPSELGTWLKLLSGSAPHVRFEIWGDDAGTPDAGDVLATTGSIAPAVGGSLSYYEAPVESSEALTSGQRYWFVATVVGESGTFGLQVGGHTRNSVYADDGTFAYSNDPAGVVFANVVATPEMAFQIELVPNILLLDDPCDSPSYFLAALEELDVPYTSVGDNYGDLVAELTGGASWDIVVVDAYGDNLSDPAETALRFYVEDGGRLALAHWGLASAPDLVAALDATVGSAFGNPKTIQQWRPTARILNVPVDLPAPMTPTLNACLDDGAALTPTEFGRAVAGYTMSPSAGNAAIVVGNAGRTVLVGEVLGVFGGDDNANAKADGLDLATNVLDHLIRTIYLDDLESEDVCVWTAAAGWSQEKCQTWCADGDVDFGEDCDDGNLAPGDDCDATCRWSCVGNCGGPLPGLVCYCDGDCNFFGDCCYDVCAACGC